MITRRCIKACRLPIYLCQYSRIRDTRLNILKYTRIAVSDLPNKRNLSYSDRSKTNKELSLDAISEEVIRAKTCSISDFNRILSAIETSESSFIIKGKTLANIFHALKYVSTDDHSMCRFASCLSFRLCKEPYISMNLNQRALVECIFGLRHLNPMYSESEILKLLSFFTAIINTKDSYTPKGISNMLFGINKLPCNNAIVKSFLSRITQIMYCCNSPYSGIDIGNSLYGLRSMTSESAEVQDIVNIIGVKVNESDVKTYDWKVISTSLYGMQCMSSGHEVVQTLLWSLTRKINRLGSDEISSWSLGNMLLGLKSMHSDVREVQTLLSAIDKALKFNFRGFRAPEDMSCAIFGLQGCRSTHPPVRDLLLTMSRIIRNSNIVLTPQAVSMMLYGLKNIVNDHNSVENLLISLAPKIVTCKGRMTGAEICTSMYGLQGMSCKSTPVRNILTFLLEQLKYNAFDYSINCSSMMILGMQSMNSSTLIVQQFLQIAADALRNNSEPWNGQNVANILQGLKNFSCNSLEIQTIIATVNMKLRDFSIQMKQQEISMSLYGMQNMSSETPEIRDLLVLLTSRVKSCAELFTGQGIGTALYGLKEMNSDSNEVRHLLQELTKQISRQPIKMSGENFGSSFFGLRNMTSDTLEVQNIISALLFQMRDPINCIAYSNQTIANILYGLRNMSSDHDCVGNVLIEMSNAIKKCTKMNGQEIGNSILGLQNMSNEVAAVRYITAELSSHLNKLNDRMMSSQDVACCLYGLRNRRIDDTEVTAVLESLNKFIASVTTPFTGQEIGMSFYGLHNMHCNNYITRQIIRSLTHHLLACNKDSIDAQAISNILYSMQSKSAYYVETVNVFSAVRSKIDFVRGGWTSQGVSNSIYGLQSLSHCSDSIFLITYFTQLIKSDKLIFSTQQLASSFYGLQSFNVLSPELSNLISVLLLNALHLKGSFSYSDIGPILFGIRNLSVGETNLSKLIVFLTDELDRIVKNNNDNVSDERNIQLKILFQNLTIFLDLCVNLDPIMRFRLNAIASKINVELCKTRVKYVSDFKSGLEMTVAKVLNDLCSKRNDIQVEYNAHLLNFEADVIIRKKNEKSGMINIEVDGPRHNFPSAVRFQSCRDLILLKYLGITVLRLPVNNVKDISYPYVSAILENAVAKLKMKKYMKFYMAKHFLML